MAYQIRDREGFIEVSITGETSRGEVLELIRELDRRDPGKQKPDLWLIARESQLPFSDYWQIAGAVRDLLPPSSTGNRTAIVANDPFQRAQLDIYRTEAEFLPFEIRVFLSEEEAVQWLKAAPKAKGPG